MWIWLPDEASENNTKTQQQKNAHRKLKFLILVSRIIMYNYLRKKFVSIIWCVVNKTIE